MANKRIDQLTEQSSLADTDNVVFGRGTAAQRITWENVVLSFGSNFAPVSHTHAISDVSGLQTALDGKSDTSHNHSISQVTGLQSALDDKADTSHTHIINDTTGLQTALNGKADVDHTHEVADISDFDSAISGKSDVGHGHAISDVSGLQTALDGKASSTHTHAISDVTGLQAALDDKADASDLAGKADASHTHDAADIVSGVLDVDRGGTGLDTTDLSGQAGQVLTVNATEDGYEFSTGGGGSGTVTSVDVGLPSTIFGASSGAITSSGTITFSLATGQTANYIVGTDGSGNVGLMALTSNQVPTLAQSKITNLVSDLSTLTSGLAGKANTSHTHAASDITSGILGIANGGTQLSTIANGDLIYGGGSGTNFQKLNIGTSGYYLTSSGSAPQWTAFNASSLNMTNQGDIITRNSGGAIARIASGAAGSFLRGAGVNTEPTYSTLILPNAASTGQLMRASGTNTVAMTTLTMPTTITSGKIFRASASNVLSETAYTMPSAAGTSGNILTSDGTNITSSALTAAQIASAITPGTSGNVLTSNGTAWTSSAPGGGSGTVTSVGLSAPSTIFSVGSSPVTSSGTISLSFATGQTADYIFGTDGSGNVGLMALTSNQVPTLAQSKITNLVSDLAGKAAASHTHAASDIVSGQLAAARGGTGVDASSAASGAFVIGTGTGLNVSSYTLPTSAGTSGNILTSNGTNITSSALTAAQIASAVAPGTSGNVLTSNGTTWTSAAPSGGGGGITTPDTPTVGDKLAYDGTDWKVFKGLISGYQPMASFQSIRQIVVDDAGRVDLGIPHSATGGGTIAYDSTAASMMMAYTAGLFGWAGIESTNPVLRMPASGVKKLTFLLTPTSNATNSYIFAGLTDVPSSQKGTPVHGTNKYAGFTLSGSGTTLITARSNGSGGATAATSLTVTSPHVLTIELSAGQIRFFANNTLLSTVTTSIPAAGTALYLLIGVTNGGSGNRIANIGNVIIEG